MWQCGSTGNASGVDLLQNAVVLKPPTSYLCESSQHHAVQQMLRKRLPAEAQLHPNIQNIINWYDSK
jgi:hypothetical protein